MSFLFKFTLKGCFPTRIEKVRTTIDFSMFELVLVPHSSWNCQFWVLLSKFAQNGVSCLKKKLTILMFWTKFAYNGCLPSEIQKLNTTIKFSIFGLVLVLNFSWRWQFSFFGPNLPIKGVFRLKEKQWERPLNSPYSN